jgi:uncharacterized membrane protein YphA (DoxX/SURF4 family)
MANRSSSSHLGTCVFGGAAIAVGIIGFAFHNFATDWQRVAPTVPHRQVLAFLAAACEIAGGLAILGRPTRRAGAALLTALYVIFTLLWVQQIFRAPSVYDGWGNFFEELSLVIGALIVLASASPRGSAWARNEAPISRIYGICCISFALVHFNNLGGAASYVPAWIPPSQRFWAITTAICFLLAAASILSGILAPLAARLLTAEILVFEFLVWLPKLIASPHEHFMWAGNGINMAMCGAAWVVADSLRKQANRKPNRESSGAVGSV